MLFSTHISPTILVIISGIWQELEIKILHLFDLVKPHVKGTLMAAPAVQKLKFFGTLPLTLYTSTLTLTLLEMSLVLFYAGT